MPTKHPPNPPLPKKPTKQNIKLTRGKSKSRVVGLVGLDGGSRAGGSCVTKKVAEARESCHG